MEDHRNGYRGFPSEQGFSLTYPGKQDANDVLAGIEPAALCQLEVSPGPGANINRLIHGENLSVLAALTRNELVRGRVNLVYIDPPFGTRLTFYSRNNEEAYHDAVEGPSYIESLRQRLILIRELLAPDGSIYVHLDNKMAFAIKIIMDEVFGPRNFRNWITRKKSNPKNSTRRSFGNIQDFILFYSRSSSYYFEQPREEQGIYTFEQRFPRLEPDGRRYALVPIHAKGIRNGETGKPWRGMQPPSGKHWQVTPQRLEELDARGEIYWSPTGNPRRKVYADQATPGVPIQDIWLGFQDERNQMMNTTGYPTEKNIDLLRRVVSASSKPGDLVLDCFAGSGTTLIAASEAGRHWIGVDNSSLAIETIKARMGQSYESLCSGQQLSFEEGSQQVLVQGYQLLNGELPVRQ